MSVVIRLFLTASSLMILVDCVAAQSLWLDRSADRTVSLEFIKPRYDGSSNETFFSASWTLSTRIAISDLTTVNVEMPFAHFNVDEPVAGFDGSSTIGNIYVGAEIHGRESGLFGEFGVRLPTVDGEEIAAFITGALSDFVDREEAFVNDAFPLLAAINYHQHDPSGLVVRIRTGLSTWVAVGDRADTEIFLVYGGQAGYSSSGLSVLAGVTGRLWLTQEANDTSEAFFHQVAVMAGPRFGRFLPALQLRIPVDEQLNELIDFVWGLSLTVDVTP